MHHVYIKPQSKVNIHTPFQVYDFAIAVEIESMANTDDIMHTSLMSLGCLVI